MKLSILFFVAITFVLSACNTVKGVGQDVQRAGGALERAAR